MRLTGPEIPRKPFPYRYFWRWYLATKSDSSCPKMGFSARNGRTCVTPQALASSKINGLWTYLDTYITKNWSKTSKSVSFSQNSILGSQTLLLAHRDLKYCYFALLLLLLFMPMWTVVQMFYEKLLWNVILMFVVAAESFIALTSMLLRPRMPLLRSALRCGTVVAWARVHDSAACVSTCLPPYPVGLWS